MTKQDFFTALRGKLNKFPKEEVEERISFYSEIIEDNIEDGLTEEQAVEKIGNVDKIASQIASEIPLSKIVKTNAKPTRKLKTWELVLLIVGSPIWLSLIVSLFAGVFSVYASLWAVVITFWAVAVCFIVGGPIAVILGIAFIFIKSGAEGLAMIGAGLMLAGLGILFVFISKFITKLLIKLTNLLILVAKKAFFNRGDSNEINY